MSLCVEFGSSGRVILGKKDSGQQISLSRGGWVRYMSKIYYYYYYYYYYYNYYLRLLNIV